MNKRPWNRVNLPVYSICSTNGTSFNMHIITYVTAISMQPKRFICGIYKGTKTEEYVNASGNFVLQLLAEEQYRLVDVLGKKSGHQIDKIARLQKRELLSHWKDFPILKNCLSVIHLNIINQMDGGDHHALLCEVLAYKNITAGNPLTLDVLRAHKMIRI